MTGADLGVEISRDGIGASKSARPPHSDSEGKIQINTYDISIPSSYTLIDA